MQLLVLALALQVLLLPVSLPGLMRCFIRAPQLVLFVANHLRFLVLVMTVLILMRMLMLMLGVQCTL